MEKTTDVLITASERKALEALAKRRGFKTLRSYLLTLIEHDAEQYGESTPIAQDNDELPDPVESFRVAWGEAMRGELLSWEEFERQMKSDAD